VNTERGMIKLCKVGKLLLHNRKLKILTIFLLIVLVFPFLFEPKEVNSLSQRVIWQSIDSSCIVDSHTITIDIEKLDDINVIEEFTIRNNSTVLLDTIDLWLNRTIEDLTVDDKNNTLFYTKDDTLLHIELTNSLQINETTSIRLNYQHKLEMDPIGKNPVYYLYAFERSVTYFTQKQDIRIKLPETCLIHYEGTGGISPPPNYKGLLEYENRYYAEWNFINLVPFDEDRWIHIWFDEPTPPLPIWAFIASPFLGLLAGVIGTVWIMRKKQKKSIKKLGDIFLSDVQKQFLKIIIENGGKISQKELSSLTGYSKNRVSRNLISLEQQKLITREKWGRNYRVHITETGARVIK
jgi:uncharacterized membrane protein